MAATAGPPAPNPWSPALRAFGNNSRPAAGEMPGVNSRLNWFVEATLMAATLPVLMIAIAAGSLTAGASSGMTGVSAAIAAAASWPFFAGIAGVSQLVADETVRIVLRTMLLIPVIAVVGVIVYLSGLLTGIYQLDLGV